MAIKKVKKETWEEMYFPTQYRARRTRKNADNKTIKRAKSILKEQKDDFEVIFKREVKKGNSKTGAKRAGAIYRKKYGATPTMRWKKALEKAKRG